MSTSPGERRVSESREMKLMDVREFMEAGYLQEVNRRFLHPMGLALVVRQKSSTGETWIEGVWDCRDDPEGIVYDEVDLLKMLAVREEQLRRINEGTRQERHGFWVQPHPDDPAANNDLCNPEH